MMRSTLTPIHGTAHRGLGVLAAAAAVFLIAAGCASEEPAATTTTTPAATAAPVDAPTSTVAGLSLESDEDDIAAEAEGDMTAVQDAAGDADEPAPDRPAPVATVPDPEDGGVSEADTPQAPTTIDDPPAATTAAPTPVQCPDGEHSDGSGGCHPNHDDVATTTTPPTATTTPTSPEPEPTTTPTTTEPTTTTPTTTVAQDENDPWERAQHEPVLGSELYPDEPEVPEDLWCEIIEDGTVGCWTEPDEPEPEPVEVWVEPEPEPVEPYAGYVPPVHPDTAPTSWQTGEWDLDYNELANDHPRPTPDVDLWAARCLGGDLCDWLLFQMKLALDYLGASEDCVLAVYYARWSRANESNWLSGAEIDLYGWHRCPTVIDPRTPTVADPYLRQFGFDGLLLTHSSDSLADRCRAVLPADVALEFFVNNELAKFREGLGCDEWGALAGARRVTYKVCDASAELARQWMEHHHRMPVRYRAISC